MYDNDKNGVNIEDFLSLNQIFFILLRHLKRYTFAAFTNYRIDSQMHKAHSFTKYALISTEIA